MKDVDWKDRYLKLRDIIEPLIGCARLKCHDGNAPSAGEYLKILCDEMDQHDEKYRQA